MRAGRWLALGLATLTASCTSVRSAIVRPTAVPVEDTTSLPVPYVSQSELLCGGAAIAMVERWWGRRGVYAEEFAHLVRPSEGGIRTSDMAQVILARGWETRTLPTTAAAVRQSVGDRIPVIALIEVARRRYHYVVIVGWSANEVIYHDPAVAPSIRLDAGEFLQRWAGAKQWALSVRPSSSVSTAGAASVTAPAPAVIDSLPCRPWLDQAADAVAANQLDKADSVLATASKACPGERLILRELAGVRFRQGRNADAGRLAAEYMQHAPSDSLGWQLLASARYLSGDLIGALEAWNAVGRPEVDLLRIDGVRRSRFQTLANGIGITPGEVLTPTRLALAQRRIADLPALATARMTYEAVAGGAVEVRAAVVERPLTPPYAQFLAVQSLRAAFAREVTAAVSSPLGAGEVLTASWRWRRADPRVLLRLDLPARVIVPMIVSFERSWASFRFGDGVGTLQRSVSSVGVTGWARPDIEARSAVRLERWSGDRDFAVMSVGLARHTAHDRLSLLVDAEHAAPLSGGPSYDRISGRAAWTMPADRWATVWSMRVGADAITRTAPLGVWPMAAGGLLRAIPLRAHPLITDDVLPASRTGTRIVHGGVAGDRAVATLSRVSFGAGIFLDGAQIAAPGDGSGSTRLYLDGGAGLRVSLAGARAPAVRIDVARGLVTDRRWGVSAAFLQPLPVRLSRLH